MKYHNDKYGVLINSGQYRYSNQDLLELKQIDLKVQQCSVYHPPSEPQSTKQPLLDFGTCVLGLPQSRPIATPILPMSYLPCRVSDFEDIRSSVLRDSRSFPL